MHSHTVLEARSPKSRCLQGHISSKVSKEESFLASSSFWRSAFLGLWQHNFPKLCGVPFSFYLLKGYTPLDLGTILIQDESQLNILNLVTSAKTFFQIRSIHMFQLDMFCEITNLSHSLILMSPMKLVT